MPTHVTLIFYTEPTYNNEFLNLNQNPFWAFMNKNNQWAVKSELHASQKKKGSSVKRNIYYAISF